MAKSQMSSIFVQFFPPEPTHMDLTVYARKQARAGEQQAEASRTGMTYQWGLSSEQ